MDSFVVALSGRIGSGKSTLASSLAQRLGCERVSFGEYVRAAAQANGLEPTGENLQAFGAALIESGWEPFCRAVLGQASWRPGQPLVVDGVRHVDALAHLKRLVSPSRLVLVHIQIEEDLRAERFKRRAEGSGVSDKRDESHSTERDVKAALPQAADLIVDGARPVEALVEEIARFVQPNDG